MIADRNDIDVFVSYAHSDRERVSPLVDAMKARDWSVWWDTEIDIGARWRAVLEDRLDHARAVCVVWTVASVSSEFVRSEASRANARGVLLPIRLDAVRQPLGFDELQCGDLSDPVNASTALAKLLRQVESLIGGVTPVDSWQADIDHDYSIDRTRRGLETSRRYLESIRARADMFAANPGAASALVSAMKGVRDTYAVVGDAMDEFLAAADTHESPTLATYRALADGRLITRIERERGHCKRIAQTYIESGGLRDSLPDLVDPAVRDALDDLIFDLSDADEDLFDAMAAIGGTLQTQAAVMTNLLVAGQDDAARSRLGHAEQVLLPLRQAVNRGMADVERLASDLGMAPPVTQ